MAHRPDDDRFRPKLGRPRARGVRTGKLLTHRVRHALNLAGHRRGSGASRGDATSRGRGSGAAYRLMSSSAARHRLARRVVVKARVVHQHGPSGRSPKAHLIYLQRDGAGQDHGEGELYNARETGVDRDAFLERCEDDRHHFRLIVSPEDGDKLEDLQAYTRDLMRQVEQDLGTRLDWVAIDHHNTGHPHSHILLRGVDEDGKTLLIARDYMAHGFRLRAAELATLELGQQTELEIQTKLQNEVDQERFTRLDRALLEQADGQMLDLDHDRNGQPFMRQAMIGRLRKLERMGLATEEQSGQWRLDDNLASTLTRMGERDDIIKTMHRALHRDTGSYRIHDGSDRTTGPIIGRLVAKGLADDLGDRTYLIVDGVDGQAHYVDVGADRAMEELRTNSIIALRPAGHEPRPADRNIERFVASHDRIYEPTRHREQLARGADAPGRDPVAVVETHVRRLEALRRAKIVTRLDADRWQIPEAFLDRAAAHEASRAKGGLVVSTESAWSLDRQVHAVGATWLDRQLVGGATLPLGKTGFGRTVEDALGKRTDYLIQQGLAERRNNRVIFARNMLATLRERELAQQASALEAETGLKHHRSGEGDRIEGVYRRPLQLASGRFAMIAGEREFALVPWRPILERSRDQQVTGIVRGTTISGSSAASAA
ncbi:MAG: DUF3363 domain-containing protein [Hyphomicrobiales bacterium]